MKILCLFANEFPYGTWEPYLETEVPHYDSFDRVYIFSLQLRQEHAQTIRNVPENVQVIPVYYASNITYLLNVLRTLNDKNLYTELLGLIRSKRFCIKNVVDLFVYVSRAHYETDRILEAVRDSEMEKNQVVFYSYRFEYQPYVAMLLKKKLKLDCAIVARAHRYDLYEEFRKKGYIPFREVLLKGIDRVYPCSQDGVRYLTEKYAQFRDKIMPRFLGTRDYGEGPQPARNGEFSIASCSNAVPVKRLHLIVDALSLLPPDLRVHWTHYGDGPVLQEIKEAAKKFPEHITAEFPGNVPNTELMKLYAKTPYDLFLNVSISEGIPVSIMEANSFGIPCIATDVGGTREMVSAENGCLLPADCTAQQIADAIRRICEMAPESYAALRARTRTIWHENFNAEKNYRFFTSELVSLLR